MIITMSTLDELYYKQLLVLLLSLEKNSSENKILVYLLNGSGEHKKNNFLRKRFKNAIFINREVNKVDDRGSGFLLFKAMVIKEYMEITELDKSLTWIDCDTIIRNNLTDLINVSHNGLKILFRGMDKKEHLRFNTGVFSIGNSKETYKMVCDWYNMSNKRIKWSIDQIDLWRAYYNNRDKINLVKLSKKFNDLGSNDKKCFFEDSIIWHCKMSHFNDSRYQLEFIKYLNSLKNGFQKI